MPFHGGSRIWAVHTSFAQSNRKAAILCNSICASTELSQMPEAHPYSEIMAITNRCSNNESSSWTNFQFVYTEISCLTGVASSTRASAAVLILQDYYNLVDVYLDAVLQPRCVTDPQTFAQEGWHYELDDAKVGLCFVHTSCQDRVFMTALAYCKQSQ